MRAGPVGIDSLADDLFGVRAGMPDIIAILKSFRPLLVVQSDPAIAS